MKYGYLNEKNKNPIKILENFNRNNIDKISHSLIEILSIIGKNDSIFLNNLNDLGNTPLDIYNNFQNLMKKKVKVYFMETPFLDIDFTIKDKEKIINYFLLREKKSSQVGRPNLKIDIEDIKILILFNKNKINYKTALEKLNIKQTTLYKYSKKEYLNQIINELSEVEKQEIEKFQSKLK